MDTPEAVVKAVTYTPPPELIPYLRRGGSLFARVTDPAAMTPGVIRLGLIDRKKDRNRTRARWSRQLERSRVAAAVEAAVAAAMPAARPLSSTGRSGADAR